MGDEKADAVDEVSIAGFESFEEVTRDFALPGVVFGAGDGILCRLRRRPDADVVDLDTRR